MKLRSFTTSAFALAAIMFAGNANAETVVATVTAYNTVPSQTVGDPCEASRKVNICGRRDVVACPRKYDLGTLVEIKGKRYVCLDRTHKKYDGRFDISFDKDVQAALNWGKRRVEVTILSDS
jgi:3D (Asp-Asp-Asp) domain-containing protein